jgi:hypothetical protein
LAGQRQRREQGRQKQTSHVELLYQPSSIGFLPDNQKLQ